MVIGEDGECEGAGLCTGMFIHPEVVMTAGHCCETGATKAICSGKVRCVGRSFLSYLPSHRSFVATHGVLPCLTPSESYHVVVRLVTHAITTLLFYSHTLLKGLELKLLHRST